jgi:hypothetical protein
MNTGFEFLYIMDWGLRLSALSATINLSSKSIFSTTSKKLPTLHQLFPHSWYSISYSMLRVPPLLYFFPFLSLRPTPPPTRRLTLGPTALSRTTPRIPYSLSSLSLRLVPVAGGSACPARAEVASRAGATATAWWGWVLPSALEPGRVIAPALPPIAGAGGR